LVLILSLAKNDPFLHAFHFHSELLLFDKFQNLLQSRHLAGKAFAIVLNNKIVIVIIFEIFHEGELFHSYEILLSEAKFILDCRIEFIHGGIVPSVQLVR
jgi:hypothetical protein